MAFRPLHVLVVGLIGIAIVVIAGVCAAGKCSRADAPSQELTEEPSSERIEVLTTFINSIRLSSRQLSYPPAPDASPEEEALNFIIRDPAKIPIDQTVRLTQRYALMTMLLRQTEISGWDATGWATAAHECEWDEVKCMSDDSSIITELTLCCDNLHGQIPEDLALLTALTSLDLGGNFLTGSFPATLARLTNLDRFFVGGNSLTGTIPELAWPNLKVLDVHRNNITGTIQVTQDPPVLRTALLHANKLSGNLTLCPEQRLVADCDEFDTCPCCGDYCCPNANITACQEAHD